MKIYLVGGAVRDKLLGLPVKEKDWVVVGATAAEMLRLGFRPVGKDFPVFLHPETNEEYALARTERKVGRGYTGFDFNASPEVTLEEDLLRRDLTINAMAETPEGQLIDPHQGKKDLEQKILRHVSPAFLEDPVRILRVARFAARFAEFGFTVAPETNLLMKRMVSSGEVDALVAERVWKELEKALGEKNPEQFFQVLAQCDALTKLFPEVTQEGLSALTKISIDISNEARFAALLYDVSEEQIKALCIRYRVPSDYRDLAFLVSRYIHQYAKVKELSAPDILQLLLSVDAFRRQTRFFMFVMVCEVITEAQVKEFIIKSQEVAKAVNIKELCDAGFVNQALADKINEKRREAIEKFIMEQRMLDR